MIPSIINRIVLGVIILVIIRITIFLPMKTPLLKLKGRNTFAEILSLEKGVSPEIRYKYSIEGVDYLGFDNFSITEEIEIGDSIEIRYMPSDPTYNARIKNEDYDSFYLEDYFPFVLFFIELFALGIIIFAKDNSIWFKSFFNNDNPPIA